MQKSKKCFTKVLKLYKDRQKTPASGCQVSDGFNIQIRAAKNVIYGSLLNCILIPD
jgi:hypothetical protein